MDTSDKTGQKSICETIIKNNNLTNIKWDAQSLNNAGYALYKNKKYKEGASLFRCALGDYRDHLYANYNLACTLSLMYGMGEKVDVNEILSLLEKSVLISHSCKEKILKDKDLDPLRKNSKFITFEMKIDDLLKPKTLVLTFTGVNLFESTRSIHFINNSGTEFVFDYGICNGEFCIEKEQEGTPIPEIIPNSEKLGKRFRVTIKKIMKESEYVGGGLLFLTDEIVKIEPVDN